MKATPAATPAAPQQPGGPDDQAWWEHENGQPPTEVDGTLQPGGNPWDFAADPEPGYVSRETSAPAEAESPLDAKTRGDIEGKLALLLMIPYEALAMKDPYCAEALTKSSRQIIKAMVPLLAQSPQVVAWFTTSGGWLLWLNLAVACKPVLQAVTAHHITHRMQTVEDQATGARKVVPTDYTAYSAA